VKLTPEDQIRFEGWEAADKHALQAEILELLAWEQYHVGATPQPATSID
jgi:hypothetical protein